MTHIVSMPGLTKELPCTFDDMVAAMLKCEQTRGLSVYKHGQLVDNNIQDLISFFKGFKSLNKDQWKLPKSFESFGSKILDGLHDLEIVSQYATYHDCGKPFCLVYDSDNDRNHFPNHAEVSGHVWEHVGGSSIVGHLIRNDMVLHTATSEEINDKLCNEWSQEDSLTLMVAALAEIHANALMFGGLESTNFKIKFKHVERRSNQICNYIFK